MSRCPSRCRRLCIPGRAATRSLREPGHGGQRDGSCQAAPGGITGFGLLDPQATRDLTQAASAAVLAEVDFFKQLDVLKLAQRGDSRCVTLGNDFLTRDEGSARLVWSYYQTQLAEREKSRRSLDKTLVKAANINAGRTSKQSRREMKAKAAAAPPVPLSPKARQRALRDSLRADLASSDPRVRLIAERIAGAVKATKGAKARALAASLAIDVNSRLGIHKSAGNAITADDMMPVAEMLRSLRKNARRIKKMMAVTSGMLTPPPPQRHRFEPFPVNGHRFTPTTEEGLNGPPPGHPG